MLVGDHGIHCVWPPHIDYLRATAAGHPQEHGFVPHGKRWWRPGWWAQVKTMNEKGGDRECTNADAEAAARSWPQPWTRDVFKLTRVDVACDIVLPHDQKFTVEDRVFFTGRGRRRIEEEKHGLQTLYIGGRKSPLILRIYCKSKDGMHTERDSAMWHANGWNGKSDVWRLEYEFHTRAIPKDLVLPRDTGMLWADALARIRMCAVPPRQYSQQNKAPTHPRWISLGRPSRRTRVKGELAPDLVELKTRQVVEALEKLTVRAGVALLPMMIARLSKLQRQQEASNGEDSVRRALRPYTRGTS